MTVRGKQRRQFERSDGFRGSYPGEVNEELAYLAGKSLAFWLVKEGVEPRIIVGRDARTFSNSLYAAVIGGIESEGGTALPIGLATTDAVAWATGAGRHGVGAGVMVTASHNRDVRDHGIKMFVSKNGSIAEVRPHADLGPLLSTMFDRSEAPSEPTRNASPFACSPYDQLQSDFVDHCCSFAQSRDAFSDRVALDIGNGVAGLLVEPLERNLPGAKIHPIHDTMDGTFPARGPDPSSATALKELSKKVVELEADFGVGFDGDADRAFFVSDKGEFVPGHAAVALVADKVLSGDCSRPVVIVSPTSWQVIEVARQHGVEPILTRIGQGHVKDTMRAVGAIAGFEPTGHFNFAQSFGQDSGLIAMMLLWQTMHERKQKLSQLLAGLNRWQQTCDINIQLENIDLARHEEALFAELTRRFSSPAKNVYVLALDGVSAYYPKDPTIADTSSLFPAWRPGREDVRFRKVHSDYSPQWWFNARCSKNERLLRLNVECRRGEPLEDITRELIQEIIAGVNYVEPKCQAQVVDWGSLVREGG